MNFFKIFFATLSAMIVSVVLCVVIIISAVAGIVAARLTSSQIVESGSMLVIDLAQPIVDTPNENPLSMIDFRSLRIKNQHTTLDVIRAIEAASVDDNIKGIYIRPYPNELHSLATLEEIRTEIARFKQSGKFVVAYSDTYSQGGYYLASVADSLYLQPEGMVVWQGVAASSIFFKGLMDKLDVEVEVFRPSSCIYKSAVEQFTRSDMSPQSREQNEALVESVWSVVLNDVAMSRRLAPSQLSSAATSLSGFIASEAVATGLVDRTIYEDEMETIFKSYGVKLDDDKRAKRVSLSQYILNQKLFAGESPNKVAVIYAEGVIVDGVGEMGEVGGDDMARLLREVREDDDIKSVVVRVNSPGGSALASNVISREMSLLREVKPVIVSMGGYAASGGYYISAPADAIVADRLTITGSIGVYGMAFDMQGALSSKLGITTDVAKSNPSADFMRSSRPITNTERAVMGRSVEQVYDTFTEIVSRGRNIPMSKVLSIAQGRVWSGADAMNLGLVDGVGGIKAAILIAADRAGVAEGFEIVERSVEDNDFSALLAPMVSVFGGGDKYLRTVGITTPQGGIITYSPLRVNL